MESEKLQSYKACQLQEVQEIQKFKATMAKIYSVWNEIGLRKEDLESRFHTAWGHIHDLVQDIHSEEISMREEVKEKIKYLFKNVSDLSSALSVAVIDLTGLTLIEQANRLEQEFDSLNKLKEKRIQNLKQLRLAEKHYCSLLAMEELQFSSKAEIPSETDLKELELQVNMLMKEHNTRYEKYRAAQQQLITILQETEISPDSSFEKDFFSGKEPLSLTTDTFMIIDRIINKAKKRKCELEEQKNTLIAELLDIWGRLNIQNDKFLSDHQDFKATTLQSIHQEIEKCKKENIHSILISLREELNYYWCKCGISESERELFYHYPNTEVSEDVLIAHEKEVKELKKYYHDIKPILEKMEKRNKLWDLLKAFDAKANDPERFKNRGGNLLKEEKERNLLLKALPTLENQIDKEIENYETETGKKFFFNGEDYILFISKQWEERSTHKENVMVEAFKHSTPARKTHIATPKSVPRARLPIYQTPSSKSRNTPMKKTITKRNLEMKQEIKTKFEHTPMKEETTYSIFVKELNNSAKRSSVLTSKKTGGTRTVTPSKVKRKNNRII